MREFFGYFDPTPEDDRQYMADEFAELSRARGGTGVGDGLVVSPTGGLTVSVSPGRAMIDGYVYSLMNDGGGPREFALSVAGSADRIDRVVLRLDLSANARSIQLLIREGAPAASPEPPALVRTDLVKEISLCRVRIPAAHSELKEENFTDERLDAAVCGALVSPQLSAVLSGKMDAQSGEALAAAIAGKASTARYNATLLATGWSASAPFTQTVAVGGILATDDPFVDVNMSGAGTGAAGTALGEAWALVGRVEAKAGSITAYCYETRPAVHIPILLKVVR